MKQPDKKANTHCPCGSGRTLANCCFPLISGTKLAQTAEQLMRSRFTAYSLKHIDYLLSSWHPDTRPAAMTLDELSGIKWLDLLILECHQGQAHDLQGTVSFRARFKITGKAGWLQENSRFLRQDGCWFYLDGDVNQ